MQPETLGLLVDIRDAARFIAADTADATYDEFLHDQRMRQSVLYSFLIIGEAVNDCAVVTRPSRSEFLICGRSWA
jgi:uncharacterized protein with HEPN domain